MEGFERTPTSHNERLESASVEQIVPIPNKESALGETPLKKLVESTGRFKEQFEKALAEQNHKAIEVGKEVLDSFLRHQEKLFRASVILAFSGILMSDIPEGQQEAPQPSVSMESPLPELGSASAEDPEPYRIYETKDASGEVFYKHADAETTRILNMIAGRGDSTAQAEVRTYLLNKTIELEELRMSEMRAAHKKYEPSFPDEYADIDSLAEDIDQEAAVRGLPPPTYDQSRHLNPENRKDLYQKLWKLEEYAGAPRIRWIDAEGTNAELASHDRAFYRSETNTVYISPLYALDGLVSEYGHSDQFSRDQSAASLRRDYDHYTQEIWSEMTGIPQDEIRDAIFYKMPSTLEYEAHRVIEPKLWKRLER